MLCRSGAARIDGVQIHFEVVCDVTGNHRALEEMYVIKGVRNLGSIMQILGGAIAVSIRFDVDDMHGGTRSAKVHSGA